MSLNDSNYNNFYNTAKGKITSFISGIKYSSNNQPILNIQNPSSNLRQTKLYNTTPIDYYRSDYIPIRRNYTSHFDNNSNNLLGNKINRTSENNNKIKIPSENRYHKSLLQTSLETIRNEIRQKRLENSKRLNEINQRANSLNDYFNSKNNTGKYLGIINNNDELMSRNSKNIELEEKEENSNINDKLFVNNNNIRKFDNDLIYFYNQESFCISGNEREKLDPIFIEQRQSEFAYNNIKTNIIPEKKSINKIGKNKTSNIIFFGAPKDDVKIAPLSNNFTFGIKPNLNQSQNKSLFGSNENKKEESKSNKVLLFGAPKENIKVEPLSNKVTFGFKFKEEKSKLNENNNEDNSNSQKVAFDTPKTELTSSLKSDKVTFGCPKTEITYSPLSSNVTFGVVSKKEKKIEEKKDNKKDSIFGIPKDNNSLTSQPLSNIVSFGVKKEESQKETKINDSVLKGSLFSNNIQEKNTTSLFGNTDKEENKKIESLFKSNNTSNIFNKEDDKSKFIYLKKKKIEENNNISLFGDKKPNLFANTEKETKTVSINAINTSGSLFGNDNNQTSLFGNFNSKKEENKNEGQKSLFGNNFNFEPKLGQISGKSEVKSLFGDNNDKKSENNRGLFNFNEKQSVGIFDNANNKNEENKDKKVGLFGDIGIFSKQDNNSNKTSLFEKSTLFTNSEGNKKGLLFGNEPNSDKLTPSNEKTGNDSNSSSIFDNKIDNKKNSLFGNNDNNENKSIFDKTDNNENKSLFGNKDNKDKKSTSLFGNIPKFNFGKS